MLAESIRYTIDEPRRAEFESAYGAAAEQLAGSPHCVGYELSRCVEDASSGLRRGASRRVP